MSVFTVEITHNRDEGLWYIDLSPNKTNRETVSRQAVVNFDYVDGSLVGIEILEGTPEP